MARPAAGSKKPPVDLSPAARMQADAKAKVKSEAQAIKTKARADAAAAKAEAAAASAAARANARAAKDAAAAALKEDRASMVSKAQAEKPSVRAAVAKAPSSSGSNSAGTGAGAHGSSIVLTAAEKARADSAKVAEMKLLKQVEAKKAKEEAQAARKRQLAATISKLKKAPGSTDGEVEAEDQVPSGEASAGVSEGGAAIEAAGAARGESPEKARKGPLWFVPDRAAPWRNNNGAAAPGAAPLSTGGSLSDAPSPARPSKLPESKFGKALGTAI